MEKPLVSVIMITYGHEKFIREAINGVFIQKTNFLVELIIANDCSPDNSDEIIKETIKNAPKNIEVNYIKHEKNLGMNPNFLFALKQARGKYIAICEGDDYWIDENKLQKQVDFLEKNPEYAIYCHNFKTQNGHLVSEESFFDPMDIKETSTIEDLARKNIVPTLTSMFRKPDFQNIPSWYAQSVIGDYPLMMIVAQQGLIYYQNEKMAVYRQNVGVWSGKQRNYEKLFALYDNLMSYFKHHKKIIKGLKYQKDRYIRHMLSQMKASEVIKNQYFTELNFWDTLKVLIKKIK